MMRYQTLIEFTREWMGKFYSRVKFKFHWLKGETLKNHSTLANFATNYIYIYIYIINLNCQNCQKIIFSKRKFEKYFRNIYFGMESWKWIWLFNKHVPKPPRYGILPYLIKTALKTHATMHYLEKPHASIILKNM
jgi:hypothetical protein